MLDGQLIEHAVELALALLPSEWSGLQNCQNVLLDGHSSEDGWFLRQISDTAAGPLIHGGIGQLHPIQQYTAFVGQDEARNKVEGRGLSRPIGSQKAHDLALLYPDADMIDHRPPLETLPQVQPLQEAR